MVRTSACFRNGPGLLKSENILIRRKDGTLIFQKQAAHNLILKQLVLKIKALKGWD